MHRPRVAPARRPLDHRAACRAPPRRRGRTLLLRLCRGCSLACRRPVGRRAVSHGFLAPRDLARVAQAADAHRGAHEREAQQRGVEPPHTSLDPAQGGHKGSGARDGRVAECLNQADCNAAPRRTEQVDRDEDGRGPAEGLLQAKQRVRQDHKGPAVGRHDERCHGGGRKPARDHANAPAVRVRCRADEQVPKRLGQPKRDQEAFGPPLRGSLELAAGGSHEHLRKLGYADGPPRREDQRTHQCELRARAAQPHHPRGCRRDRQRSAPVRGLVARSRGSRILQGRIQNNSNTIKN